MILEQKFFAAYNADACYQPTPTEVYCRNCGTRLKVFYAEGRLYAVKCGYCETVTLVRANNPTEAARYVGEYGRETKEKGNDSKPIPNIESPMW